MIDVFQRIGTRLRGLLLVSLWMALCFAAINVAMSIHAAPAGLYRHRSLLFPLGMAAAVFLLSHLLTTIPILVAAPGWSWETRLRVQLCSGAYWFTVWNLMTARAMAGLLLDPYFRDRIDWVFGLSLIVLYPAWQASKAAVSMARTRNESIWSYYAMPFVLIVILVFQYQARMKSPLMVAGQTVVHLCYVLLILAVLYLFRRFQSRRRAFRAFIYSTGIFLLLQLVQVPGAISHKHSGKKFPDKPFSEVSRSVRQVILICVDTLRPDSLSCYGNSGNPTPVLDQLAEDGYIFERAFSPAPWTRAGVASFLTGVNPRVHGIWHTDFALPKGLPTLAEFMSEQSYFTTAIGDNFNIEPRTGLDKGFDEYNVYPRPIVDPGFSAGILALGWIWPEAFAFVTKTEQLTDMAIRWLQINKEKDFFFYLHYYTPHLPYDPPMEFLPDGPPPGKERWVFDPPNYMDLVRGAVQPDDATKNWIRSLYDAEVRYVDSEVGRFLDRLKAEGIYDSSLIVFTSDHGEEFWEHGAAAHGHTLYKEQLWVPLIIKLPDSRETGRSDVWVSTESIPQTILEICEIEADMDYVLQPSIYPLLKGQPGPAIPPIYATSAIHSPVGLDAIMADQWAHIAQQSQGASRGASFDMAEDFEQMHIVSQPDPERLKLLRTLLSQFIKQSEQIRSGHGWDQSQQFELTDEAVRELEKFGYL